MDFAHDAQWDLLTQVDNICISIFKRGPVVEHQKYSGNRLNQENEKRQSPHAPSITDPNTRLGHAHRMKMQKHIREYYLRPPAFVTWDIVAEYRLPDLRSFDLVHQARHFWHNPFSLRWFGDAPVQTCRKDSGLSHCPFSYWNFVFLSTRIWPSSARTIRALSKGRGAGPSKLIPDE